MKRLWQLFQGMTVPTIKMEEATKKERLVELQQDVLRLKLRYSDKVFQLSAELDQDIKVVAERIKTLQPEVKEEVKTVK